MGPYRIPRGGGFELVSCPHYLAEIVIYAGLLILLGRANALVWLIFAWVVSCICPLCCSRLDGSNCVVNLYMHAAALQVANLLLAAMPTHRWYLEHFSMYPKHRRALIPYIY